MGGEINATSTEGVGTTFTVRLLLSEAAPSAHPKDTRPVTGHAGAPRRLLLVDDDAAHLDIVQNLLRPLGFVLFTAPDGARGLALAAECQPDLAMVDLSMPGLSGWQVAERLRGVAGLERLKIVIVSANAHEFSPGGAGTTHDAFLVKPIDMQRLIECLGAQLNLQWTHAGPGVLSDGEPHDGEGATPPRHHVDDLYQLGLIGHVRGIQAKLREMEADPATRPFAARMRGLVASFDLKRYMNVLEGMRKHG
jgi:CheY-like chemotaxis protein